MGGVQGQHGVHPGLDLRLQGRALDQVVAQRAQQAQVERPAQPAQATQHSQSCQEVALPLQ